MEQRLRSASSVDELMSLIYPSYWASLKCRSKLSAAVAASASRLSQKPQLHRHRPLAEAEEPTFAAAYFNLDLLKSKPPFALNTASCIHTMRTHHYSYQNKVGFLYVEIKSQCQSEPYRKQDIIFFPSVTWSWLQLIRPAAYENHVQKVLVDWHPSQPVSCFSRFICGMWL